MDKNEILALVTIIGFAIQQFLQTIDVILAPGIKKFYLWYDKKWKDVLKEPEFKKSIMMFTSLMVFSLPLTLMFNIRILNSFNKCWDFPYLDPLVTSLVIAGGSEGLNSLTKFFSYLKDKQKMLRDERQIKNDVLAPPST